MFKSIFRVYMKQDFPKISQNIETSRPRDADLNKSNQPKEFYDKKIERKSPSDNKFKTIYL